MTTTRKMPFRPDVAVAAALMMLACDTATGPGRGDVNANRVNFERAKAKWAAAGLQDYAYEAQWAGAWMRHTTVRVVVSAGVVDSVIGLTPGQPLAPSEANTFGRTIDELFGWIEGYVYNSGDASHITYDADRGYPTAAALNLDWVTDDEVWFSVTLVRP